MHHGNGIVEGIHTRGCIVRNLWLCNDIVKNNQGRKGIVEHIWPCNGVVGSSHLHTGYTGLLNVQLNDGTVEDDHTGDIIVENLHDLLATFMGNKEVPRMIQGKYTYERM